MKNQKFVCIECPRGCDLTVTEKNGEYAVAGNFCPRGKKYALAEVSCPQRVLTSSVRGRYGMISVKTKGEIDKSLIFPIMAKVRAAFIDRDVAIGDVLIEKIDGKCDVVATVDYKNTPSN